MELLIPECPSAMLNLGSLLDYEGRLIGVLEMVLLFVFIFALQVLLRLTGTCIRFQAFTSKTRIVKNSHR